MPWGTPCRRCRTRRMAGGRGLYRGPLLDERDHARVGRRLRRYPRRLARGMAERAADGRNLSGTAESVTAPSGGGRQSAARGSEQRISGGGARSCRSSGGGYAHRRTPSRFSAPSARKSRPPLKGEATRQGYGWWCEANSGMIGAPPESDHAKRTAPSPSPGLTRASVRPR
jgi:hypothetical protein